MTRYQILLFVHVTGVITWIGTAIALQILAARAVRSSDPTRVAALFDDAAWLSNRVFMPASIVVVGFGFWMVAESPVWTFGHVWIVLALVGFALSAVLGMGVLGPRSHNIAELMQERGAADPEVRVHVQRFFRAARIDLVILLAIVLDMIVKPGA